MTTDKEKKNKSLPRKSNPSMPKDMPGFTALASAMYANGATRELVIIKFREIRRRLAASYIRPEKRTDAQQAEVAGSIRSKRIAAGRAAAESRWGVKPSAKFIPPSSTEDLIVLYGKVSGNPMMETAILRVVRRDRQKGYVRIADRKDGATPSSLKASRVRAGKIGGSSPRTVTDRFLKVAAANIRKANQKVKDEHINSIMITYGTETHDKKEWAKIRGLTYTAMRNRFRLYPVDIALDPAFAVSSAVYRKNHPDKFKKGGRRSQK